MCSPQSGSLRDVHRVTQRGEEKRDSEGHAERFTELYEEEKREEGDRGDQEEKRRNQRGREQSSQ